MKKKIAVITAIVQLFLILVPNASAKAEVITDNSVLYKNRDTIFDYCIDYMKKEQLFCGAWYDTNDIYVSLISMETLI